MRISIEVKVGSGNLHYIFSQYCIVRVWEFFLKIDKEMRISIVVFNVYENLHYITS
jgi:hypothetical protein